MQANELLTEGINLMVFGMGFVFLFLVVLVWATSLMSRLVTKLLPEEPLVEKTTVVKKAAPSESVPEDVVAAIALAIRQHRQVRP